MLSAWVAQTQPVLEFQQGVEVIELLPLDIKDLVVQDSFMLIKHSLIVMSSTSLCSCNILYCCVLLYCHSYSGALH